MANKKGAIHVDWAISMGLFLLYVVLLFILLKPGAEVEYKPENLFTIIENNFFPEINIVIKEVNLIVDKCKGPGTPPQLSTKITLESTSNDYRFSELIDKTNNRDVSNDKGIGIGSKININCGKEENDFHDILSRTNFIATSYPEKHIDFSNPDLIPTYSVTCNPDDKEFCMANLGTVNDFFGFSEEYIEDLKKIPYADLSKMWGFPLSKRFKITTTKLRNGNKIEISDGTEPPAGVNVFAKEYQGVYLNSANARENVKVRIIVW
ncbi:hypothetical protein HYX16_06820 [Candidatus Woesearchaeota archaeon]|nr:hypothetical protein [Candidatus Woesearchaeota archaeon]